MRFISLICPIIRCRHVTRPSHGRYDNAFQTSARIMMQHTIDIEVRYYETDGQGIVHHANYFQYFELARVQMLKAAGHNYADLERDGYLLVVHKIGCRFLLPARFGDTLRILITVERATAARIDHSYKVYRGEVLLAEGESTLACVNRDGQVQRMPSMLYEDPPAAVANEELSR